MPDEDNLLADLDLSQFNDTQRDLISQNIYKLLENRMGEKMAALVADEKFAQFEAVVDQGSEDKVDEWLEANVPGYENLAAQTLEELKQEVRQNPQAFLSPEAES